MKPIPSDAYLAYALSLSQKEKELGKFYKEWLPDELIDCHAHCNLPQHVIDIDEEIYRHMMSTFPSFSLQQSYEAQRIFYPGKGVRTLRFASAFRGIDHRHANEYLLNESKAHDRIALYGIPDDIGYTISMLYHPRVTALKMYPAYFRPRAATIYEYFPPEVLEEAQSIGIPIILHLPRMITDCLSDLLRLIRDFPRLIVILAHLGLPHLPVPGLGEAYAEVAHHETIFMDTAMIPSAEVVEMALKAFGLTRIMFGSDEPLNMIRSTVFEHPIKGQRLITEYFYHWVDPVEHQTFLPLARGITHTQWQALAAIKGALDKLPITRQEAARQSIFHDTAMGVFKF